MPRADFKDIVVDKRSNGGVAANAMRLCSTQAAESPEFAPSLPENGRKTPWHLAHRLNFGAYLCPFLAAPRSDTIVLIVLTACSLKVLRDPIRLLAQIFFPLSPDKTSPAASLSYRLVCFAPVKQSLSLSHCLFADNRYRAPSCLPPYDAPRCPYRLNDPSATHHRLPQWPPSPKP